MGVWLRSWDQTAKWGMATKSSPRPKKACMSRSRVKTTIIVFFNIRGIVHKEFVPPGQTVNHTFYKDVLERLQKRVQQVRKDVTDDWVLHHDKAPAHTVLSIWEFLAKKNIPVLPHPPYGPEPATCDFYLSLSWRVNISGRWKTYKNCNRWATYTYGKWLPVLLLSLDKTLEPVCDFPRVTLRRR